MVQSPNLRARIVDVLQLHERREVGVNGAQNSSAFSFRQSLDRELPAGFVRRVRATADRVQAQSHPAGFLHDLSAYMEAKGRNIARMMDEVVDTGSADMMVKTTVAMSDSGADSDLIAKTIGKAVNAVDQLTSRMSG